MDRDQGLPRDVQRGPVRADGRGQVVAQGDERKEAYGADADDRRFDGPRSHVTQGMRSSTRYEAG